jgi:hypothetical protein
MLSEKYCLIINIKMIDSEITATCKTAVAAEKIK